jgi:hypothetical protein
MGRKEFVCILGRLWIKPPAMRTRRSHFNIGHVLDSERRSHRRVGSDLDCAERCCKLPCIAGFKPQYCQRL